MNVQGVHQGRGDSSAISVVIGDNHRLFAEALSAVLVEQGFEVRAIERAHEEILAAVRATCPDVCLLGHSLHDEDGRDVIGSICAASPGVKVVVLAEHGDRDAIAEALEQGAAGYVHKSHGIAALTESLRKVREGAVVVDAVPKPINRSRGPAAAIQRLARHLTLRERECLGLLVEGLDTQAMANRLGVAPTTVRSHVQSALTKLGAHSRLEAAALTVRYGLLGLPSDVTATALGHVV